MEPIDSFGSALLASDVDHDGRADLTAIASQENDPSGAAWFLPGATATGSSSFGPTGLGMSAGQGGAFGWDLAG
jgi:hypothetical protein